MRSDADEREVQILPALPAYVEAALTGWRVIAADLPKTGSEAAYAYHDPNRRVIVVDRDTWFNGSVRVQQALLIHEVGHLLDGYLLLQHTLQQEEGQAFDPWALNIADDCSIHLHHPQLAKVLPFAVTFEMLGLPPMPVRLAYQVLKQRQRGQGHGQPSPMPPDPKGNQGQQGQQESQSQGQHQGQPHEQPQPQPHGTPRRSPQHGSRPSGCGSRALEPLTGRGVLSLLEALQRAREAPDCPPEYHAHSDAGTRPGYGRAVTLGNVPPWARFLLQLLKSTGSRDPHISVLREHHGTRSLFMGVMPVKRLELDVLIDVSGSISDETVARILAALQHSSRLRRVRVVVFSESAAAVPRNDPRLVAQVVRGLGGGGTLFGPAAELRRPGVPAIWVTDGYLSDQWPVEHPGSDGWIIIQHGATPPPHSGTLLYHEEEE